MTNRRIPKSSREWITATVTATVDGVDHDPTADTIEVQLVKSDDDPSDTGWHAASWEPGTGKARAMVGPGGSPSIGVINYGSWDVYWRITDNPEIPVRNSGTLVVF